MFKQEVIMRGKNIFIFISVYLVLALFVEVGISSSRPSWPKYNPKGGVYIAKSSETIPFFPKALSGYRSENNLDYFDNPFPPKGRLRIFQSNVWTGIPDFPGWANRCGEGIFMLRWRSSNPDVHIVSTMAYAPTSSYIKNTQTGAFGYIYGTNCEQPWFKFIGDPNTVADIYYEVKFWQAAP